MQNKEILNLVDTIIGEVNRMCVTEDLAELDTMAFHATTNIKKLQDARYKDMRGDDYQRHMEQLEHDMRYEPTYNPDDGSM